MVKHLKNISDGPIFDRTINDPISVSNQTIIIEKGVWKMWYMSFTKWEIIDKIAEPFYVIKYAESNDGIKWFSDGTVCIDVVSPDEGGIARPFVLKENGIYKMWYSYRKGKNYRKDKSQSYRIGYGESKDGINWYRMDDKAGIDISESGWDSEMIAYPNIYQHKGRIYMLYNGNNFGMSGIGYAEMAND